MVQNLKNRETINLNCNNCEHETYTNFCYVTFNNFVISIKASNVFIDCQYYLNRNLAKNEIDVNAKISIFMIKFPN